MIILAQTDRWLICGRPRSGKTNLMRHLIFSKYGDVDGYFIIYDPDHELGRWGLRVNSVDEVEEVFPDISNHIVYQPYVDLSFDERRDDFDDLCSYLNTLNLDFAFGIDEISNISVTAKGVPVEISSSFKISISRRGKRGMEIFVTSQKPKESTVTYVSQCTKIGIFDIFPHDIVYIEEKIGITLPTETINMEFGEKVRLRLDKYEFFIYDDITHEFKKYKLKYCSQAKHELEYRGLDVPPSLMRKIK